MRTRSKTSCFIPVIIEELNIFNLKVLGSRGNNTTRTRPLKVIFSVGGFSYNQGSIYLSVSITILSSKREFNTRQNIVSSLEIVKVNISNSLSDGSISLTFPSCEIIKIGSDRSILPVRVIWNIDVKYDWFAWLFSWNHVMEYSQSVSTH